MFHNLINLQTLRFTGSMMLALQYRASYWFIGRMQNHQCFSIEMMIKTNRTLLVTVTLQGL